MKLLVPKTIEKTEIKKLSDRELVDKYRAICNEMKIQAKISRLGLSSYEQSKHRLRQELRKRGLFRLVIDGETGECKTDDCINEILGGGE